LRNKELLDELGIPVSLFESLGIEESTGKGVRVVVIDSGIMDGHPHVGRLELGVRIDKEGAGEYSVTDDLTDAMGHGTACAGVIRFIAPECSITSVKILDAQLMSSSAILVQAIYWAIKEGNADVVNLSLGTRNEEAVQPLRAACEEAMKAGTVVVAAACDDNETDYPACLPEVIGVTSSVNGGLYTSHDAPVSFCAPSYPRRIPGKSREDNFKGPSFAAARITGLVALMIEANGKMDLKTIEALLRQSFHSLP
jgi:subtilisin family serine protease